MKNDDPIGRYAKGQRFSRALSVTADLLEDYGRISGDYNPLHVDDMYAVERGFTGRVAYGNLQGMLLSALVGMDLHDRQVLLLSERFDFKKPVYIGDSIELVATVTGVSAAVGVVELGLEYRNGSGDVIASGKCQVRIFQ